LQRGKKVKIDFEQIRELLAVFSQTDVTEITIESGEEKITLKKAAPPTKGSGDNNELLLTPQLREPAYEHISEFSAEPEPEPQQNNGLVPIASPMVGTFYSSPSPSAPPFVRVGDRVAVGQTVCIIEAMKLMNDLPAEISGKIIKVCVENGTTVEYGQSLFLVDPKA
jgi:acetyl-CoA carboxylase biotin carboxyl carrier protein